VDYRLPEGTDILTTSRDLAEMESEILAVEGVTKTVSFIGRGSPRFTAMTQPEQPNSAYALLIVESKDVNYLNDQMSTVKALFSDNRPDAEVQITRAEFAPGKGSKIEMRYSGPDPIVLRQLAEQTLGVYLKHNLIDRKTDWRAQSLLLAPQFNEANARLAGISRNDLAKSIAYNTHGMQIGLIRDDDKLVPIIARAPDAERVDLRGLKDRQVWSATQREFIPITQVVSEFRLEPENTTIFRRDRIRTITVQANPPIGHNVNQFFEEIKEDVETLRLPPGYSREWGGEFENNKMANESLGERMPMAFALMFFITVLMFGALKQPIVIWLTVPMTICGVAIGLLVTDLPLTFPSFLGILSLSGMLIKNCIVLVDEIDKRLAEDAPTLETMMLASLSRLRPVMLAALTTIFGMSPLLTDAFFKEMAVCIMSGLMFATLLTLIAVPVFYRIALGSRVRPA
jgi:multidrug efflux pump subunit AcrB